MIIENPVVLLVDDSKIDVLLMRTVFERAGFVLPLQFVHDGAHAIAYLSGEGPYCDRTSFPFPTVVLLDLNMPRKNGFEVLEWVRGQPALKRLRIYVLSSSSLPQDIRRAYDLGANSYFVKPGDLETLIQLAKILGAWLRRSHFAPVLESSHNHAPTHTLTSALPPVTPHEISPPGFTPKPAVDKPAVREWTRDEVCRFNEELEIRLTKQTAELIALRADNEIFTRVVGHDLRSPLMTIGGYADLLGSASQLDDQSRHYVQKITEATGQLTRSLAAIRVGEKNSSFTLFHEH